MLCLNSAYSQSKTEYFKEVYNKADKACYLEKIQLDINKFDQWLVDSLPVYNSVEMMPLYQPSGIDLQNEKIIYALAVTLTNTENYKYEDDIYDYLIIDSLRTLIAICIDDKMTVIGITDKGEPGSFFNIMKDLSTFSPKKSKRQYKELIRNIKKEEPELILFCNEWYGSFWYIKNEKIYRYDPKTKKGKELNEVFRKCPDINMIKNSDNILHPYAKQVKTRSLVYRKTGNTPAGELRICQPVDSFSVHDCNESD